jgi:hypothetical protein
MIEIEIQKGKGKIVCIISVLKYENKSCRKRIYLSERLVKQKLIDDYKLNPGSCLQNTKIDNFIGITNGTWIFKDQDYVIPVPKKTPIPPPRATSKKKTKKVEKKLDKSEKDVIIEVQEKTLPLKED